MSETLRAFNNGFKAGENTERKRILKLIPDSWLHPRMSKWAVASCSDKFTTKNIEKMFLELKNAIGDNHGMEEKK